MSTPPMMGSRLAMTAIVSAIRLPGIISPTRPDRLVQTGVALFRWGPTPAAGYTVAAARFPDEVGIVDEAGTLTFLEIQRRTNALAHMV